MKIFKSVLFAVVAGILLCSNLFASPKKNLGNNSKPNIIYILADDMGIGDVQSYNKDGKIPTPNIDRLSAEGMRFLDAHTNSSVCTPTRYGILTGRYAWRTHLKQGVLGGHSEHLIDAGRQTVANLLKSQGYSTACFGKWHLGMDWSNLDGTPGSERGKSDDINMDAPIKNGPNAVGFDYFFGLSGSLNMNPHCYIENDRAQGPFVYHKTLDDVEKRGFIQPAKQGWIAEDYEQEEVLTRLAEKTCQWITDNKDRPFFVYLPLPSPHSPIVPRDEFKGKSKLNEHGDFCMETDWVVGEVLKTLDKLGLAENTMVVYTSDNGTSPKAHVKEMQEMGHYTVMNYRGLKGTLWEGGHRVPFIVRYPEMVKASSICNQPICTTDLMATCADFFKLKLNGATAEDSYSFLPALKGKPLQHTNERMIVHHSDNGYFSARRGKWKLSLRNDGGSSRSNPKDKPVIDNADILLFDMEKDPEESTNLSAKYPEVVESLKKELARIIQQGRSTPGTPQKNDPFDEKEGWPQLDVLKAYMN